MPVLEPTSEDNRIYEFCVLYPYGLSQKEEQEALKAVETHFAEAGGTQVAKDAWGRRGLAYPIKGNIEGNYVVYYYEMDPAKLKELDEALRITPNVLRHIVVKPPKGYEITKYSEKYEEWKKSAGDRDEMKRKEKEAVIERKVAEKAKRQVRRTEERKKVEEPISPESKKNISDELDKLISDDIDI